MSHVSPWFWFDAPIAPEPYLFDVNATAPPFLLPATVFVDDTDGTDDDESGAYDGLAAIRNAAPAAKRPRRRHPGVEFAVDDANRTEHVFRSFEEAASFAVGLARSNGARVNLDVLVHSPAGARWWAGDDAVADYHDDPDASVFERIEIRADSLGRVP
jgi:hypothetical protein